MESILEVMHTVWDSVLPDLKKEENKAAKKYLRDTFNDEALEKLTSNFTSSKAQLAILRIASNLPKANLTRFAATSLAKLMQVPNLGPFYHSFFSFIIIKNLKCCTI